MMGFLKLVCLYTFILPNSLEYGIIGVFYDSKNDKQETSSIAGFHSDLGHRAIRVKACLYNLDVEHPMHGVLFVFGHRRIS